MFKIFHHLFSIFGEAFSHLLLLEIRAYLWQFHSNEFPTWPQMLDGIRLVTTAATTPTTTLQSQEVINTIPAPATATTRPTIPLTLVLVSVSASAAMCRPPLCKCRLSSGQTAHCNLHLNDPARCEFAPRFLGIICKNIKETPSPRWNISCAARNYASPRFCRHYRGK